MSVWSRVVAADSMLSADGRVTGDICESSRDVHHTPTVSFVKVAPDGTFAFPTPDLRLLRHFYSAYLLSAPGGSFSLTNTGFHARSWWEVAQSLSSHCLTLSLLMLDASGGFVHLRELTLALNSYQLVHECKKGVAHL